MENEYGLEIQNIYYIRSTNGFFVGECEDNTGLIYLGKQPVAIKHNDKIVRGLPQGAVSLQRAIEKVEAMQLFSMCRSAKLELVSNEFRAILRKTVMFQTPNKDSFESIQKLLQDETVPWDQPLIDAELDEMFLGRLK